MASSMVNWPKDVCSTSAESALEAVAFILKAMKMMMSKNRRFMSVKENDVERDIVYVIVDELGIIALAAELANVCLAI